MTFTLMMLLMLLMDAGIADNNEHSDADQANPYPTSCITPSASVATVAKLSW